MENIKKNTLLFKIVVSIIAGIVTVIFLEYERRTSKDTPIVKVERINDSLFKVEYHKQYSSNKILITSLVSAHDTSQYKEVFIKIAYKLKDNER